MNDAQKAHFEAQKQKLEKLKVEAENLMKRLRGEEVESDKEVEGDLDLVPSKFEAAHGPKPEQVESLIEILLGTVEHRRVQDGSPPQPVSQAKIPEPEKGEETLYDTWRGAGGKK
jgi:hypothetical protein